MKKSDVIVLITGANRGIGHAFVEAYLAHGAKKIYAAARRRADLDKVVALDPTRVHPVVLDVTKPEEIKAATAIVSDINVLINNAGALSFGGLSDISDESLRRDMEVNYFGLIHVTQAMAPLIEKNGGGSIANLLSVVSLASMPGIGAYNASKAAAWSATLSFRADLAKRGIGVFGVFPGPIDTDMAKGYDGPKNSPAEVAQAILAGLAKSEEDVYVGDMTGWINGALASDPKALERELAKFLPG